MSSLKGFNTVFDSTLNNELQDNIIEFLDWSLLNKGNYFNVTKGETSHTGQDYSLLQLSSYPHYSAGQAWDGFRKNWIWQSGVSPPSGLTAPIVGDNHTKPGISGVYVDDIFYPSDTTGDYAHSVDYFNGRVIFNNPIPTGSKVQAEYSYKYINVIYANNVPWLREIQYNTLDVPSSFGNGKGEFEVPSEMRIQLPAIAVEIVPRRNYRGFAFGGGGQWVWTDVLFHCIAEDAYTRNSLLDMVSFQNDMNVEMFDSNNIAKSGAFPIDYRGVPVSGALRYPDLINYYSCPSLRFTNFTVQGMEIINSNFSAGIARCTAEYVKSNI